MPGVPTVKVVSWKDPTECWIINVDDYDPTWHILWDDRERALEALQRFSETEEDLSSDASFPPLNPVPDVPSAPRRGGWPKGKARKPQDVPVDNEVEADV